MFTIEIEDGRGSPWKPCNTYFNSRAVEEKEERVCVCILLYFLITDKFKPKLFKWFKPNLFSLWPWFVPVVQWDQGE